MHKFSPSEAARLERPERYELIGPAATLRRFGLAPGMHFLDVGAGTGFFSRAASAIVGPAGRVFAAEMSDDMLEAFKRYGTSDNVTLVRNAEYEIPLASESADFALLAFVLHENVDRLRLLDEVLRTVRKGGRLLIVEWKKQQEEKGPPRDERLAEEELDHLLEQHQIGGQGDLNSSHYYRVVIR